MIRTHYDLRDVRAICELSRAKGFREAADALAITPSALSRRVAKLEDALGGLLVKRTTRSMELTPLGRRLVSCCQPSLDSLDDSIEEMARVARGMEGQISIGCVASVSYALLAPVLARFRKLHPNLRLGMREGDGATVIAHVLNHQVDFGLTTVAEPPRELASELVAEDPFVLVCSRGHPLATKRRRTWREISTERLMGYKASSSIRKMIDGQLAREGVELLWFDEVDTLASLMGYLDTGAFVGVIPKLVAAQLPRQAVVNMAAPTLARRIFLIRRDDVDLTPPAQILWNEIRKIVLASVRKPQSR